MVCFGYDGFGNRRIGKFEKVGEINGVFGL